MSIALVCGGHPRMWDERTALEGMASSVGTDVHYCALNAVGIHLPKVDHWFISNFLAAKPFVTSRECLRKGGSGVPVHSPGQDFWPVSVNGQKFWPVETVGTVAMFAVRVLLTGLGYDKVVLAGVHLSDDSGYFYGAPWERFGMPEGALDFWVSNKDLLSRRVRSMGGRTEELLGRANEAWLKEV